MVKTDCSSGPLKTDHRGRVCSTVALRQAVLAKFERSGLSGPQFARSGVSANRSTVFSIA